MKLFTCRFATQQTKCFSFRKSQSTIKAQSAKSVCFCVSKNRQLVYIAAPYAFVQPPKTSSHCAFITRFRKESWPFCLIKLETVDKATCKTPKLSSINNVCTNGFPKGRALRQCRKRKGFKGKGKPRF